VPHYLPGENPWVAEYAATHNLPQEVTLGGPAQMYPEYRERMRKLPVAVFVDPNAPAPAAPAGRGQGPAPAGGRGGGAGNTGRGAGAGDRK